MVLVVFGPGDAHCPVGFPRSTVQAVGHHLLLDLLDLYITVMPMFICFPNMLANLLQVIAGTTGGQKGEKVISMCVYWDKYYLISHLVV